MALTEKEKVYKLIGTNSTQLKQQLADAAAQGRQYAVLPPASLNEQEELFRCLSAQAEQSGLTLLIETAGEAADTDRLLKALSGMKGAKVYWNMTQTVTRGEPFRTTYKALERFIKAVEAGNSTLLSDGMEFILKQGYSGILIC